MPLHHSQLIFSTASTNLNSTLTSLKRADLSISNRLRSIAQDAEFVREVAATHQLPLIANERCGSWYISPDQKAGSAYFKSTDGHHGQWSFSLRRLNLQVLDLIGEAGGCIIVDSTRRGKTMPDALSKTVPIWIAVLNHLLFPGQTGSHTLQTPEKIISRSEHAEIEARISRLANEAKDLKLNVDDLRLKLRSKPLQPAWVCPDDDVLPINRAYNDYHLIVLCTASGRTSSTDQTNTEYVQGAADDQESWACGLDATTFWTNKVKLMATTEEELPIVIAELTTAAHLHKQASAPVLIKPTNAIWICDNVVAEDVCAEFDIVVSCCRYSSDVIAQKMRDRYLPLACNFGKVGSRELRTEFPKLDHLVKTLTPGSRILVCCHSGKDLSIGVALAIICMCCDSAGALRMAGTPCIQSKASVKQRLSWIMVSFPEAKPSRATLQSVNNFLLG